MRFVLDMNLSAAWATELAKDGHDAVHWNDIGAAKATDDEILAWATSDNRIVMTADLDFGTAVASRALKAVAIVQIRDPNTDPEQTGPAVRLAIRAAGAALTDGAILTLSRQRARLRPGPGNYSLTDEI